MKFSMVVPSFNHAIYLPLCLDSILLQKGEGADLEVLVMDGGSSDGSAEIIRLRSADLSYWQSRKDGGQTDALIQGFARSSGEIMSWLNSDDMLVPGALAIVRKIFNAHPEVDVIYGDMELIGTNGHVLRVQREIDFDPDILLWVHDYIPQPSTFWRRRIWERVGGLRQEFSCAMDYDLWMRFLAEGARFRHVPRVLSRFRVYPEQKNQRLRAISNDEDRRIRARFLGREPGRFESHLKWAWHKARRIWMRALSGSYRTALTRDQVP